MTKQTLLYLITVGLSVILLYHEVFQLMMEKWMTADGSHGFLIMLVCLYLIWYNWKRITKCPVEPQLWKGGTLTAIGCFMLFSGNLLGIASLQEFSLILVILGVIGIFWGTALVKIFLLPVGYLVFLTGLMEDLLDATLGFQLQMITSWGAANALALLGMPVFLSKTIIQLPHISLEVVRECSGINHLVALLALAVPLAFLTQKTAVYRSILIGAALLIGIFSNILRVTVIGMHTFFFPEAGVHGFSETLGVTFVFFFGMVLLVLLSIYMGKVYTLKKRKNRIANTGITEDDVKCLNSSKIGAETNIVSQAAKPVFVTAALVGISFILIDFFTLNAIHLQQSLETLPVQIAGYSATEISKEDFRVQPLPADDEVVRRYQDSAGNAFKVFISYYALQGKDHRAIDPRRFWLHQEAVGFQVPHLDGNVIINKINIRGERSTETVYFWYAIDDRIVTSRYAGTLITFWNSFANRRNNAAMIVIQTDGDNTDISPFISELLSMTQNHLAAESTNI